jgi:hypothetical protein
MSPVAGDLKTHCTHGHEYTPENTFATKRGWRECRACQRDRLRKLREDPKFRASELAYLTPGLQHRDLLDASMVRLETIARTRNRP